MDVLGVFSGVVVGSVLFTSMCAAVNNVYMVMLSSTVLLQ